MKTILLSLIVLTLSSCGGEPGETFRSFCRKDANKMRDECFQLNLKEKDAIKASERQKQESDSWMLREKRRREFEENSR